MLRWKSKCEYKAGKYPFVAFLDLFFLLLLLFVLSSSMLYLPGVLLSTNAGQIEQDDEPMSTFRSKEDFSQYVIADKIVLTVTANGANGITLALNMKPVSLDDLENELEQEATKLKRIYTNTTDTSQPARKGFRPKLVLSAAPDVSVEILDTVLKKIRDRKMDVVFKTMSK